MKQLAILAAATLLIGCGPKPAVIPPNWQTTKVEGITVAFPPNWILWDAAKNDFQTKIDSPAIRKMRKIRQENAKQGVVKLMALDPAIQKGDFIASGNVIVLPDPKNLPAEEVKLTEAEIEEPKTGKIVITSFHVSRDKRLYFFTFSAPATESADYRNTLKKIAQSISP